MRPLPALAMLLLLGCDGGPSAPSRPSGPPRPVRPPLAMQPEPTAPLATEAPIASSDASTLPLPLARCIERNVAALPPELAGALGLLDGRSLAEDGCRLDLAVRGRTPALCDAVTLGTLRETCLVRSAMVSSLPDRCPVLGTVHARDPVCVAVASRDVRLCAATRASERARCLALTSMNVTRCDRLDPLLQAPCARDVTALRGLLEPAPEHTLPRTTGLLVVGPDDASVGQPLRFIEEGVFADDRGALWVVDPAEGWPRGTTPAVTPRIALTAPMSTRVNAELPVEARLELPGHQPLDTRDGSLRGSIRWQRSGRTRSAHILATVFLSGISAGLAVSVELRLDTFVRDVVSARWFAPEGEAR